MTGFDRGWAERRGGFSGLVLLLCWILIAASPASAQPRIYGDISGAELEAMLEAQGVEAELVQDEWGDPVIYGSLGPLRFRVWPHDCRGTPRRCKQVDFSAGFKTKTPIDLERLDAFNEKWVFGKAYLADDGTAYVDFPVNLSQGITEANMIDNIRLWKGIVQTFADYVQWFEGS